MLFTIACLLCICTTIVTGQTGDKEPRYYTQDIIVELVHENRIDTKDEAVLAKVSGDISAFFTRFDYGNFYEKFYSIVRKDDPYKIGSTFSETIKWLNMYKSKIFAQMKIDPLRFYEVKAGEKYVSYVTFSMDPARLGLDPAKLDVALIVVSAGFTYGAPYKTGSNEGILIDGVSLDWLTTGQSMIGMITGGPGGLPVSPGKAVTETDYTVSGSGSPYPIFTPPFMVKGSPFINPVSRPVRINVYVLDTLPRMPDMLKAYERYSAANPVFKDMMDSLGTRHTLTYYSGSDANFGGYLNEKYGNRNLSDHGLFIAGIVNLVSPDSNLRLVEVMNCRATGSFDSLFWGFARVLEMQTSDKPFIVNTSLTTKLMFPGNGTVLPDLGDDTVAKFVYSCPNPGLYVALLEDFVSAIKLANGQVVSAAGNDSEAGKHLLAGYPARLPGVIAVGSSNKYGKISGFSNDPGPKGFLAFGGETDASGNTIDGPLSIYISSPYTDSVEPNVCGWARWPGSSFATGFVSGLMALQLTWGKSMADSIADMRACCDVSSGYAVVPLRQGP